ncbi:hypothetical protein [Aliiglaciecola sp. LCG003]|uniref:hypothetical protein n=1 Tax=Aliiglaciecola sp. LCG003 TaxID=3053655 RepID=UPI0025734ABF|nr:hypothetical protein [Aliiglaciecola sp. LCG003]WJG08956.1 hypothetical protein QR722_16735 [Aliiglaciecola sp. LCG003]
MKQVIFLFFIFASSNVYASINAEISICNTCTSTNQFESRALHNGEGEYLIVNLEAGTAKRYRVVDERFESLAIILPLPTGFEEDLLTIIQLKQAFDVHEANSNSSTYSADGLSAKPDLLRSLSNGCGTGEPWSPGNVAIPDFPFATACNNHDICYAGNSPKSLCDAQFYYDMNTDIEYILDHMGLTEYGQIVAEIVFQAQRDIYYYAVINSQESVDAYCQSTLNTSDPLCNTPDPVPPALIFDRLQLENRSLTNSRYNSTGTITATCELWSFPNGWGGVYFLQRNCTFRYIP